MFKSWSRNIVSNLPGNSYGCWWFSF
jgi:hypothetical protein